MARMKTSARHLLADAPSEDVQEQETQEEAVQEQTTVAEAEPDVDSQPGPVKAEEAREPAGKSRKGEGSSRKS